MIDVADVGLRVGERQLHRLDLQVHAVGGIGRPRGHLEVFQDPQGDECHDPLAVGRYLVHRVPAVGRRDRAHPVGAVRGEVVGAHRPAVGQRVCLQFRGHVPAVERLPVGRGDPLERGRVIGKPEELTGFGRAPPGQERLGEPRLVLEQRHLGRPLLRDRRRHQKAVAAIGDRGLEQLLKRKLAELGVQLRPRRHRAGHGHRVPAERGNGVAAEVLRRPGRGGAAGGVQPVQPPAVPDDGKSVRADAVGHRLHHGQGDGGGDRGVHGAAPRGEHAQTRLGGEGLRRAHHIGREDRLSRPRVREAPAERCGHLRETRPSAAAPATSARPAVASSRTPRCARRVRNRPRAG